jgi:MOSC domain-containing protein YiiM
MVKTFHKAGLPGIYFAVVEEGEVAAGDSIELVHADPRQVTVTDMLSLMFTRNPPQSELQRILAIPRLAAVWREEFEDRLG